MFNDDMGPEKKNTQVGLGIELGDSQKEIFHTYWQM